MNILALLEGTSDEEQAILKVLISKNPPWYADLWKEDGSFYQIRLVSEKHDMFYVDLNYYRPNPGDNTALMSKNVLAGEWWNTGNLRKLSEYRDKSASFRQAEKDFIRRITDRLQNGYFLKSISITPDSSTIISALTTRKIKYETYEC